MTIRPHRRASGWVLGSAPNAPTFLDGLTGVLDIGSVSGQWLVISSDPSATDQRALGDDWRVVGQDLLGAIDSARAEQ